MKNHATKKRSRTNWARIDALKNSKIDTSDIPEQGKAFFKRAMLRLQEPKTAVTIRLDRQFLKRLKTKLGIRQKLPPYSARTQTRTSPESKQLREDSEAK